MSREELVLEAVERQREVIRVMLGATLGDLLDLELTMPQLKALAVTQRQPGCTIGMLAQQLGVKTAAASLIADRLVRNGAAVRAPDAGDGRRVILTPTAEGLEILRRVRHGGQALLESWIGQLTPDDLLALGRGLQALAGVARRHPLAAGPEPAGVAARR